MVALIYHTIPLRPGIGDPSNFLSFTKIIFSTYFASSDKSGSTEKESRKFLTSQAGEIQGTGI